MSAPDIFELDPVISLFYEAALDPERWPAALASMARLGGAQAAALVDMDYTLSVLWRHVLYNVDEEAHRVYLRRYAQIDPRLPVMMKSPELRWVSDLEALPDSVRLNSPVYQEYLLPYGLKECLMVKTAVEGMRHGNVVLFKLGDRERFDGAARSALDLVLPHLDRAIRISRRLAAFSRALAFGGGGVDACGEPAAALGANGAIREANRAFDEFLESGAALRVGRDARLGCVDADAHRRFRKAFADALELAKGNIRHAAPGYPVVTLDRLNGPPLLLVVAPIMQMGGSPWFEQPGVLVKISDPLRPPSEAVLQQGFGLTAAEARLARELLGGGTLALVAARIGVSANTAKTQLQGIFQKTRTARQHELVAVLRSIQA